VVRVLPDRSGPDKSFDYLWPHPIDDPAELIGAKDIKQKKKEKNNEKRTQTSLKE